MSRYIGVDIGNSGLKVSQLDVAAGKLANTQSFYWNHASADQQSLAESKQWQAEISAVVSNQQQAAGRTAVATDADVQSASCDQPNSDAQLADGKVYWLISSVQRSALGQLLDELAGRPGAIPHAIVHEDVPVLSNTRKPTKVGIDRLLAALAASRLVCAPHVIVIQAGSAVTVDLVSTDTSQQLACFEGGAILPGIPMMLRMLSRGTDLLPEVDADSLVALPQLPGRDTENAMLAGAASGLIGGVQHLVRRYREQFGQQTPVVLSGGDGLRLAPRLSEPLITRPHLVQLGLLELARLDYSGERKLVRDHD